MKQFLYLDTSKIASYLAQVDGGSLVRRQFTTNDSLQEGVSEPSQKITITVDAGAEGDIKVLKGLLRGGISITEPSLDTSFMQSKSASEIAEYVVHDDIYNSMLEYLKETNMLFTEPVIGKYTLIEDFFKYNDIEWTLDFVNAFTAWQKIENSSGQITEIPLNRNLRRQQERHTNDNKKTVNVSKNNDKTIELPVGISNLIELVNQILPSLIYIHSDNLIAFIKKEYLRENTPSILLKSNKKLTVMGFTVSNYKTIDSEKLDFFSTPNDIPYMAISVLDNLHVNIHEELKIVEPIAIYYDEDVS